MCVSHSASTISSLCCTVCVPYTSNELVCSHYGYPFLLPPFNKNKYLHACKMQFTITPKKL